MNTNKRKINLIVFYISLLLITLFLTGQIVLVSLYGPTGSRIAMNINGYPDYISLSQVLNGNKLEVVDTTAPTKNNQDRLIRAIVDYSMYVYQDNDMMLKDFVLGSIKEHYNSGSIYDHITLDGGMLASMYSWGIDSATRLNIDIYKIGYELDIHSVNVSSHDRGLHTNIIVAIDKNVLVNMLSISDKSKEYLVDLIKEDTVYATLDYVGVLHEGQIVAVVDKKISLFDSSVSTSRKLVEYIEINSKIFENLINKFNTMNNSLGIISSEGSSMIVRDR